MDLKKLEEVKAKVTEYVNEYPGKSILAGVGVLFVGYVAYRWLRGSQGKTNGKPKVEDSIKEVDTPGNPDAEEEESKTKNPRFVPQTDSEDEPLILKEVIKPKRDSAGILDRETLIRIFDKRSTIRGIRKLDKSFKDKRRAAFQDQIEYKNLISYYHDQIERKRENNLEYICRAINVSIDDIENSQEKYFGESNLAFVVGTKEFANLEVPTRLNLDKALEIYDDIKGILIYNFFRIKMYISFELKIKYLLIIVLKKCSNLNLFN